mmetsp:Transcript_16078/g.54819  ORF Transcript_16078/g.54819 Transcript_16078/m.54819 type:complete len:363 (-) Transcript_16078:7-1095(-)
MVDEGVEASIEDRLDMSLDQIAGTGGKAPRGRRGAPEGRRNEPYKNTAGRTHLAGATLQDIARAPPGQRVLKVGVNTTANTLAGSISHVTREGDAPTLLALGACCLNQAVKGIAIARRYLLEEGLEVRCLPAYRDRARSSVALHLVKCPAARSGRPGYEHVLTVANTSKAGTVAGAVAGKTRDGVRVCLKAIGAETVSIMMHAIATAREYLERDSNGVDIYCLPEFIDEESSGGATRSVMKVSISPYSSQGGQLADAAAAAAVAPRREVTFAPVAAEPMAVMPAAGGMVAGGGGNEISVARAAAAAALAGLHAPHQPSGVLTIDADHAARVMRFAQEPQQLGSPRDNLTVTVRGGGRGGRRR